MKTKVLDIVHPSQSLLNLVRKLQADKDAKKKALLKDKSKYFVKNKAFNG